jgi:uncharacterized protein
MEKKRGDMERILLWKKPKNVTVIEGFPGFGLVATIATGYMIEHLKCEKIGSFYFKENSPTLAIHKNQIIDPIGIFYDKKTNIVIIHAITSANGLEWRSAEIILDVAKELSAKEIICIEGVGSEEEENYKGFHYTKNEQISKKLKKLGINELGEGIVVGVTSALLLKKNTIPVTCLFSEAHTKLPDSRAAAKTIEMLDQYLGLKIDFKPLLKEAEKFEEKLKDVITKAGKADIDAKEKKSFGYIR